MVAVSSVLEIRGWGWNSALLPAIRTSLIIHIVLCLYFPLNTNNLQLDPIRLHSAFQVGLLSLRGSVVATLILVFDEVWAVHSILNTM
jgi:hypothetical protein